MKSPFRSFLAVVLLILATAHADYLKVFLTKEQAIKLSLKTASESNVSPFAIYAISHLESGHNIYAYNPSNKNGTADMGLMQINSTWLPALRKSGLNDPAKIYDPEYNFKVGAWVLRQCIDRFGQSWKSIDCYNKGPGNARESSSYINKFIVSYSKVPFNEFQVIANEMNTQNRSDQFSPPSAYATR